MASTATKAHGVKSSATMAVTTPSDRTIVMTRVFDAPRSRVFEALFKPELVRKWLGPRGWEVTLCTIEPRVGGSWRYQIRGPEGKLVTMHGSYREIIPNERYVTTEAFDGHPGESINTGVLTEAGGKTTLTLTVLYQSNDIRDGVLDSGMEPGAAESYDRLAELLSPAATKASAR